jgi:hypothetical protein
MLNVSDTNKIYFIIFMGLWILFAGFGIYYMNSFVDKDGNKIYPLWKSILYPILGSFVVLIIGAFAGPEVILLMNL